MKIKYYHTVRHYDICRNIVRTMKKLFSIMSNFQTHYHFKLDFQKVDHYTGGKWLIHSTKHGKDNDDIMLQDDLPLCIDFEWLIVMPPPLGSGGIMFLGCPSVRRLKYPLLICTWVRWSTRPTVTVLRHVHPSVRPSREVSGHLP